jgi:exonuclease VII small subunit
MYCISKVQVRWNQGADKDDRANNLESG